MQPNTTIHATLRPASPTRRGPSLRRLALGATALAVASLLAACGGGSSDDATPTTSPGSSETSAPDSGTDTGGGEEATTTVAGSSDLDLCAEVTKEDVAAILTEANLVEAAPNTAITAPSCGYKVEIGGAGSGATADVVTITWNDPSFFDSQQELQTSATELTGFDTDAFSYDDGGEILVRGESGTWQVTQGVELTDGGQPATPEQLVAIAKLVQGL